MCIRYLTEQTWGVERAKWQAGTWWEIIFSIQKCNFWRIKSLAALCGLGRPRVTSDLGSHDLEVFLWCKKILILALHTKYKPCSYSGTTSNRILNDEMASSGLWIVQILYFRPIPELRLLIKSFLNLNKVCSSQSDKCRLLNRCPEMSISKEASWGRQRLVYWGQTLFYSKIQMFWVKKYTVRIPSKYPLDCLNGIRFG